MKRKTFVIDTSVLLYDPKSIMKFAENDVIIPMAVLEELDRKKKLPNEIGKNSRDALRFIDNLSHGTFAGDLHEGLYTDTGSMIRLTRDLRVEGELPSSITSSKILITAKALQQEDRQVVIVSNDFLLRIKAESIGLEAEDYENLKYSFEKIYSGLRKVEVEKVLIDQFYKDGHIGLDGVDLFPNEYCLLKSMENSSAIGRFDAKMGMVTSLLKLNADIWGIKPLNVEQRCAFDMLLRDDIKLISLAGPAGTGKTLMALACGLRKVFDESTYSKILVSRPIIPLGQDIGYLPGTKEEKLLHWMQPVYDNLEFLCGSTENSPSDTMRWVLDSNKVEMEAVTYIRGRSLPQIYIIIDEAQNLTPHEVKTIISRAGEGTKVILAGDPSQIDNPYLDKDSNGLTFTIGKFAEQRISGHIVLEKTERSELAALAAHIM